MAIKLIAADMDGTFLNDHSDYDLLKNLTITD